MNQKFKRIGPEEVAVLAAAVASVASAFCTQLVNPGFEEGGRGWHLPRPNFSVVDGAGRGATKGLVCEGKDTNVYQIAYLELPFVTGQQFDVSVWARDESLSNGKPGMCVEYFGGADAGFRYIDGVGMKPDSDCQPKDPHAWRRYTAHVGPLEPEVKHCRLELYVRKGVAGRCVFDDVEVDLRNVERRGQLFTDRSDDRAFDGDVRIIAKSYADTRGLDGKDVDAFFTIHAADGRKERVEPEFFKDGRAEVVLGVDRFQMGPHAIAFTVKDKKGGAVLDEMRVCFTRLAELPAAASWFDRKRRMIVDGKPEYPLFVYIGDWCLSDSRLLPALKSSPFDKVICYIRNTPKRSDLDLLHSNGIRVVESLGNAWVRKYGSAVIAPDEEIAHTIRIVNGLKDHPALLGWYLCDEPPPTLFPRLRERYKAVRALDPAHFCSTVLCHARFVHDSAAACDVVGLDIYPVKKGAPTPVDFGQVARDVGASVSALRGGKPFWLVVQAFADAPWRFPTYLEMRSMTWQGLVGGADGIVFYSLDQMLIRSRVPQFDEAWGTVCRIAQEVKEYEAFLLSDEEHPAVGNLPKGLFARAWKFDGKILVAVCNTTPAKIDTVLEVSAQKIPVSLDPYGVFVRSSP